MESAPRLSTPPIVTTDFLYVRFIGDRSIDEKDFGKIQRDRILEMKQWADELKKVEIGKIKGRGKEVALAMIAANNHYAGFGPGTVNLFRKMVGLSELSWENRNQLQERLEIRKRQLERLEQDEQIRNSSKRGIKNIRKSQSSLTEFIE
jgi:hypothetical protein